MKRASQIILLLMLCSVLLVGFDSVDISTEETKVITHMKVVEAVEKIDVVEIEDTSETTETPIATPTTTTVSHNPKTESPKTTTLVYDQPNNNVFKVTAYCICYTCCGKTPNHPDYGITKSGVKATPGRTIAVDPTVIPLGSVVTIDGQEYVAEDTGKAINGNRIDICFDNHQDALNFGVQYKEVIGW